MMRHSKRLLVAIDDSEASHKAVEYVSTMIDGRPGYHVCLLHGLPPAPPFEHGGASDPMLEEILDANLQKKRAEWLQRERQAAQPLLEKAKRVLRRSEMSENTITTRFAFASNVDVLVTEMIEAAKAESCDTIVVGRETFTGLNRLFKHHVADDLIRRGHGYTIWVVE